MARTERRKHFAADVSHGAGRPRRAGFDLFSEQEVITFTRQLVEVALPRIPAEQQEGFLLEVRALGSR
jgi:hypothetical protein